MAVLPSLTIIDDFLAEPHSVRRAALALDYDDEANQSNFPGRNSSKALPTKTLEQAVSNQIGVPVVGTPQTSHGRCRITLKNDKGQSGVHVDPAFYSGILYLSRPEDCEKPNAGGTDFFRHKKSGLDRVPPTLEAARAAGFPDINAVLGEVVNKDTTHPAKWQRTIRVPIRFNRLILFSPWLFHTAAPGFGTDLESGRLAMLLFFDRAGALPG
ncbi:DUF6445 family protein [Qipengyuania sp. DSG2-2]|uniref:DUF6445 family protein n=1 Tax=Qipengyuania sp. DGS2-2 TaxID=3349631 RepID=UPI0036D31480